MIFILFSLPYANSVVSGIQPELIADSGSSYTPPSLLDTGTNTSVMNASSLNGSPQSIINNMRNSDETLPIPGKQPQILPNKITYSLKIRVRYQHQVTALIMENLVKE